MARFGACLLQLLSLAQIYTPDGDGDVHSGHAPISCQTVSEHRNQTVC